MSLVYISSTYLDLQDYRKAAAEAIRRAEHSPIGMEDYSATEKRPLDKCLEDVRRCAAYVGLIGWRHGYVPPGSANSITICEYEEAGRKSIPRLLFLCPDESWPADKRDSDAAQLAAITAFRARVRRDHIVEVFENLHDLKFKVVAALKRELRDAAQVPPLLPFRCNRTLQYEEIARLITPAAGNPFANPLVCFAAGEEPQAINKFLACLREDIAPRVGLPRTETLSWKEIPWPEESSPARFQAQFDRRIAGTLDTARSVTSAPITAKDAIDRAPGLLVLHSRVYTDEWNPERALALRALIDYWCALPIAPRSWPALLIVTLEFRPAAGFFQHFTTPKRNKAIRDALADLQQRYSAKPTVTFVPELDDVRRYDAEQWADTDPVQSLLGGRDIRDDLHLLYGDKNGIAMRPLAKDLETVLIKTIQERRT